MKNPEPLIAPLALAVLALAATAGPAPLSVEAAPAPAALTLHGRVTDPSGAPVAGASLSLRREAD